MLGLRFRYNPLANIGGTVGQLDPLFSKTPQGHVSTLCLNFTPKIVKIEAYRSRYNALKEFLTSCGIAPEQEITAVRTY